MGSSYKLISSPLVSVVMSVYNGERHLIQSITSVLQQTYRNIEFVIVNDASNDQTPIIIERFENRYKRIKLITNKRKIGLAKSLNKAIKISGGKYIARQDDDDLCMNTRIENQVKFLEENNIYAMVGTGCIYIDKNDNVIGNRSYESDWRIIKKNSIKENQFLHPSVMIRKDILNRIGGYNENMLYGQDYELWLRLTNQYKCTNLEEPYVSKRISRQSIGNLHRRNRMLMVSKALFAFLVKSKRLTTMNIWYYFLFLLQGLIPNQIWNLCRQLKNNSYSKKAGF